MKAETNRLLSLYFMKNNPIEALLIKDIHSDEIAVNSAFANMFKITDVKTIQDVIQILFTKETEIQLFKNRISSTDNSNSAKPIRISKNNNSYNLYVYFDKDEEITIIHARDRSEFEKLSTQLNEYAEGLIKNVVDLEVSKRKLLKSKERLANQVKASSKLGLTMFENYKSTQPIFNIVTEIATQTLDVDRCGIWLTNIELNKLICNDLYISATNAHEYTHEFPDTIFSEFFKLLQKERIIDANDAIQDRRIASLSEMYLMPNRISSILISSIIFRGKIIGMISFEHSGSLRSWEEDENGFAVIVADHISRILSDLEKEKLESQLLQSQKMETIGNLAGGLAHDFNNVLGGITGTLSLLKSELESVTKDELKSYVDMMDEASERARDMVQQLLALSRKQDLLLAPVDLNLAIKHVLKIVQNTFDKSVELRPNFIQNPAVINADPTRIEQVFLNICVNAYHSMTVMRKKGEKIGGSLTIDITKVYADKYFCETHPDAVEGHYWLISTRDTGVGIPKEIIAKIFDPFFTTKKDENVKGTGLGLAMVYNIVKEHKGFINVYSEVGRGSVFNIYFPVLDREMAEEKIIERKEFDKGVGCILVIDDEELIRKVAQKILEKCGYTVLIAENGEIGIELFQKHYKEITAVLLDMAMPKKSGRETFYEMKEIDKNVKVLLASGYKHDKRAEEILNAGVKGFIQKPYTLDKLSEALKKIITEE